MYCVRAYERKVSGRASDEEESCVCVIVSSTVPTRSLYTHYMLFKQQRVERAITHVGLAVSQG